MLGTAALRLLLTVSAAYALAIVIVAERFRRLVHRRPERSHEAETAAVSILVPLQGVEPGLFENLAAYCRLRHRGPVQIVVGSLDADDPALPIARDVASQYATGDFHVVAGAPVLGPNRKVSLLAALARHARHRVIAAIDSDVRVTPDYLSRVLPPLFHPGVGLVSCLYRAPRPHTLAQAFEALCVAADFCPSVMLAHVLGRSDIALGASLVLHRATLDEIGGFATLVEYLADDHRLAEIVSASGKRVTLAAHVVESNPDPATLGAAVRHQVRWGRTVRACAPWGYAANIVTHGVSFAACAIALAPVLPSSVARLAIVVVLLRLVAAAAGARALGATLGWTLALVPLRDLTATAIWVASFANGIEWRGRRYRLMAEGRLIDAAAAGQRGRAIVRADAHGPLAGDPSSVSLLEATAPGLGGGPGLDVIGHADRA